MVWGVLERNQNFLKAESVRNGYVVPIDAIADFIRDTILAKMDAHIIVGGQNGVGKSYLQLAIAKRYLRKNGYEGTLMEAERDGRIRNFFAFHSRRDLREAIQEHKRCVFVIDELGRFFNYRRTMTAEQSDLYHFIEVARSHANVFVGASRDYTKLDINYRNAKAQLLIYLLDKVVGREIDADGFLKTKYTYGAVFCGNPAVEHEDKFLFASLRGYPLGATKYLMEKLPTWVGNIVVYPIQQYGITDEELRWYEQQKDAGIKAYSFAEGKAGGKKTTKISRVEEIEV